MRQLKCPNCGSNIFIRTYHEIWRIHINYDVNETQDEIINELELDINYECENCHKKFTEEEVGDLTVYVTKKGEVIK